MTRTDASKPHNSRPSTVDVAARLSRLVRGHDAPCSVIGLSREFGVARATLQAVAEARAVRPATILAAEAIVTRVESRLKGLGRLDRHGHHSRSTKVAA